MQAAQMIELRGLFAFESMLFMPPYAGCIPQL